MTGLTAQQLCQGNLGANIFTDGNFGSGTSNIVTADPGIAPGYLYQPIPATPQDGSYVITNNTATWSTHFPTWLRLTDNSDDPNGYFMLVNASFSPGEFYTNQVTGLCENTLYEFSADIINVIRIGIPDHIFPNVSFLIDDVIVFSTGDILQTETWVKYGFTFSTAVGQTEVKLSLRNNAPGGSGNDLALDNISFQPCGPDAFISADETLFLCSDETDPTEISAEISTGNPAIIWQISRDSITWTDIPGATSSTIFHDDYTVGKFYYRYISAGSAEEIVNDFCSIISDVLVVEVLPLEFTATDTICFGEMLQFGSQTLTTSGTYIESFDSTSGCDSTVTLDLFTTEKEILDFDFNGTDPTCYEDTDGRLELILTNGLLGPYTFDVNGNSSAETIRNDLAAGEYTIQVINQNGCVQVFETTLNNPPEFILTLPSDTIIEFGEPLDVNVSANENIEEYTWSTEELSPFSNQLDFAFTPAASQTHTAFATNQNGCPAEQNFSVTISIDNLGIYFPNIISPNSNDDNSVFTIGAKPNLITEVTEALFYDRWGNLVAAESNTLDLNLWDGRINGQDAEIGVYVYLIELELADGNLHPFSGSFVVLR